MKQKNVDQIFTNVSEKYDLMNDLMSFGMHRLWKERYLSYFFDKSSKLLDTASGSGDIAIGFYKKAVKQNIVPDITICDSNSKMLDKAKEKAINANATDGIKYAQGYAEDLPFQDEEFDYYSIAFGIRNVNNIEKSLQESYRVLKDKGSFFCLEFSPLDNGLLSSFYNCYSNNVIPILGEYVANNREAYEYLVDSINNFPKPEKFASMIYKTGFKDIKWHKLSFGIAVIYTAYK